MKKLTMYDLKKDTLASNKSVLNDAKKICNQFFIKDTHRDKSHNGTIKCAVCGEESHWDVPFPFRMTDYVNWTDSFTNLHTIKGCNSKIKDANEEWQSKSITLSIATEL